MVAPSEPIEERTTETTLCSTSLGLPRLNPKSEAHARPYLAVAAVRQYGRPHQEGLVLRRRLVHDGLEPLLRPGVQLQKQETHQTHHHPRRRCQQCTRLCLADGPLRACVECDETTPDRQNTRRQ
jgi:hypothetical protein